MSKMNMTQAAQDQRKAAAVARWQGRGTSATVRVDKDAAEALKKVPLADRRKVASDGVRSAVKAYSTLANIG